MTTPCKGTCGRLLRPNTTRVADAPGTVPERMGGYCKKCLHALPEDQRPIPWKPLRTTPPNCVECGHKIRAHGVRLADQPGTLRAVSGGICSRCWHEKGAELLRDPEAVRPGFDEVQARAALVGWLSRRDGHGLAA